MATNHFPTALPAIQELRTTELILQYIDNELSDHTRLVVENAIKNCKDCFFIYEDLNWALDKEANVKFARENASIIQEAKQTLLSYVDAQQEKPRDILTSKGSLSLLNDDPCFCCGA